MCHPVAVIIFYWHVLIRTDLMNVWLVLQSAANCLCSASPIVPLFCELRRSSLELSRMRNVCDQFPYLLIMDVLVGSGPQDYYISTKSRCPCSHTDASNSIVSIFTFFNTSNLSRASHIRGSGRVGWLRSGLRDWDYFDFRSNYEILSK